MSIKARPILAEKTTFRGSERPISHPFAATSFTILHEFTNFLRIHEREHRLASASSYPSMWENPSSGNPLHDNNLSLSLFSAKVYLNEPSFAAIPIGKKDLNERTNEVGHRRGRNNLSFTEPKFQREELEFGAGKITTINRPTAA